MRFTKNCFKIIILEFIKRDFLFRDKIKYIFQLFLFPCKRFMTKSLIKAKKDLKSLI